MGTTPRTVLNVLSNALILDSHLPPALAKTVPVASGVVVTINGSVSTLASVVVGGQAAYSGNPAVAVTVTQ